MQTTIFLQAALNGDRIHPAAPRNPNIQYHLAVVLQQLGRSAAARATLETLLDSGVTFANKADAEKLLQDLKRG